MKIRICEQCRKPYLATLDACPKCPSVYNVAQDSWSTLGCLVLSILPLLLLALFWLLLFLGMFFR